MGITATAGYAVPTHVSILGGYIRGGDGAVISYPYSVVPPESAVILSYAALGDPNMLTIAQDAVLEGGHGVMWPDAFSISTNRDAAFEIDPSCQATVRQYRSILRELTSVTTSPMIRGTDLQARVVGPAYSTVALFASLPSSTPPIDIGIGTVVVDPFQHVVVGAAAVGAGRVWNATVPVPASLPDAFALVWQATSLDRRSQFEVGLATASVAR